MQRQQFTGSLQITQAQYNNLQLTQNTFNIIKPTLITIDNQLENDDIFELSLDENSLSFHIQKKLQESIKFDQLKQSIQNIHSNDKDKAEFIDNYKKQTFIVLPLQQQRKRKRKEIFEKFKQSNIKQQQAININNQPIESTQLMNTFDQIFCIKQIDKNRIFKKQSQEQKKYSFRKKISSNQNQLTSFAKIPMITATNESSSPQKRIFIKKRQSQQNKQKIQQLLQTEEKTFNQEENNLIRSTNSFLMQNQSQKLSKIQPLAFQQQISIDSNDLQHILKSQIFNDEILNNTIQLGDVSYKNFQISTINSSIFIKNSQESKYISPLNMQNRFGLNNDKSHANLNNIQDKSMLRKNLSVRNLVNFQIQSFQQKTIVKKKYINTIQNRIPIFLREVRKRNTVIPNFLVQTKYQSQFYQQQNKKYKQLLFEFKKSLQFLDFLNQLTHQRSIHLRQIQTKLMNTLTVHQFLNCGWQNIHQLREIQMIKPQQNFIRRPYNYSKVKEALKNYIKIVKYNEKNGLNLQDSKAQQKYFEIRNKFWQIQKNIKMISQDIYTFTISERFPNAYYDFLKILKGQIQGEFPGKKVQYLQQILMQYYSLKLKGDVLCYSQIGKRLKNTIEKLLYKQVLI